MCACALALAFACGPATLVGGLMLLLVAAGVLEEDVGGSLGVGGGGCCCCCVMGLDIRILWWEVGCREGHSYSHSGMGIEQICS